jgi:hypothetical protein
MSFRRPVRPRRQPTEEIAMPTLVVRYRTKPERAEENQHLVEKVFAELDEMGATGFAYASFRLEDGVTFVHVVVEEEGEDSVSLAEVPAFRAFQAGIADRCDEQPVASRATVVGAHRMMGGAFG